MKLAEKEKAIRMRRDGFSLSEISNTLNIAKSTASVWLRDQPLSEDAQVLIAQKRTDARVRTGNTHRARTDTRIKLAQDYAHDVLSRVSVDADTSRLLCALIYWCEGVKIRRSNTFGFTNSDPNLIRVFMRLFREGFDVDESKLRLTLHVHEYHDASAQLRFWSKVATIPLTQCHKPYKKPNTGVRKREGYQGCVSIRYFDIDVARRLESIAIAYLTGL